MSTEDAASEKDRAPRLDLFAVVAIKSGKKRVILVVRNISSSGVLLEADDDERKLLPEASVHEISVFDRDHEQHRTVTLKATVARHDEHGVALTWKGDAPAIGKVERLIAMLKPRASDA